MFYDERATGEGETQPWAPGPCVMSWATCLMCSGLGPEALASQSHVHPPDSKKKERKKVRAREGEREKSSFVMKMIGLSLDFILWWSGHASADWPLSQTS